MIKAFRGRVVAIRPRCTPTPKRSMTSWVGGRSTRRSTTSWPPRGIGLRITPTDMRTDGRRGAWSTIIAGNSGLTDRYNVQAVSASHAWPLAEYDYGPARPSTVFTGPYPVVVLAIPECVAFVQHHCIAARISCSRHRSAVTPAPVELPGAGHRNLDGFRCQSHRRRWFPAFSSI